MEKIGGLTLEDCAVEESRGEPAEQENEVGASRTQFGVEMPADDGGRLAVVVRSCDRLTGHAGFQATIIDLLLYGSLLRGTSCAAFGHDCMSVCVCVCVCMYIRCFNL